jgi:hypothetical protein
MLDLAHITNLSLLVIIVVCTVYYLRQEKVTLTSCRIFNQPHPPRTCGSRPLPHNDERASPQNDEVLLP